MKRLVRRKSDGRIVEQYAKSTQGSTSKYNGIVYAPVFDGWEILDMRDLYAPKPTPQVYVCLDSYYAGELDQS